MIKNKVFVWGYIVHARIDVNEPGVMQRWQEVSQLSGDVCNNMFIRWQYVIWIDRFAECM